MHFLQGPTGCAQMLWRNSLDGYLRQILNARVYDVAVRATFDVPTSLAMRSAHLFPQDMLGHAAQRVVEKTCPAQRLILCHVCAGANSSRASCLADRSYRQQLFAEARRPATGETFENVKICSKI